MIDDDFTFEDEDDSEKANAKHEKQLIKLVKNRVEAREKGDKEAYAKATKALAKHLYSNRHKEAY